MSELKFSPQFTEVLKVSLKTLHFEFPRKMLKIDAPACIFTFFELRSSSKASDKSFDIEPPKKRLASPVTKNCGPIWTYFQRFQPIFYNTG